MDGKILVTGAAGFLGRALVSCLAAGGFPVTAMAHRHRPPQDLLDHPLIKWVWGDITDANQMQNLVGDSTAVIHTAAALRGSYSYQYRCNVGGTRNVFKAAVNAGSRQFIHVSSIAVYGFYKLAENIYEDTPFSQTQYSYALTKREAEAALGLLAKNSPVAVNIIRPGMIYGPGSTFWTKKLFRLSNLHPLPFVSDGSGSAHPIYLDDVVELILRILNNPDGGGEIYNCTPDPAPTWRQFLGGYAHLAGNTSWLAIPPAVVKPAAWAFEFLQKMGGGSMETPILVDYIQDRVHYRMAKTRKLLDWQPAVDLQAGLRRCIPYLAAEGLLKDSRIGLKEG